MMITLVAIKFRKRWVFVADFSVNYQSSISIPAPAPKKFVKFNGVGLLLKLDHLTCSGISRIKPTESNGIISRGGNLKNDVI